MSLTFGVGHLTGRGFIDPSQKKTAFPVILVPVELDQQRLLIGAQLAFTRLVNFVEGILGYLG
jgi:hypothetical protein